MNDNDLVFLVQLSGGPTAGRDKSVINAHVSKQTHSRRRKEKLLQAQRAQDLAQYYGQTHPGIHCLADDTKPQIDTCPVSPTWQQVVGCTTHQTSPTSGSFDEFDPSEGLDEKATGYLRFGRDVLEPAVHNVGYRGWAALQSPRQEYIGPDLLTGCTLLDGNLHVHRADRFRVFVFAVLAYCASGVATVNHAQDAHHDALNYTISCMKNLREYLENLNHNIDDISEDLVYRLFRAEVLANNHPSALAHGKLLRNIFEYKSQYQPIKLDVLSNTLYQDSHRTFSSWSRPIFDHEWIQQQFRDEWQQADAMFDHQLVLESHHLSPCLQDEALRPLLASTKKLLLQTQSLTARHEYATPRNFFWFASQCEWLQIRLMDYYIDRERLKAEPTYDAERAFSTNVHMSVTLATLYILRHAKNDVYVQGQPLFQGSRNIYLHMDARLNGIARDMSTVDSAEHSEAIIFLLFVIAIAEHYYLSLNSTLDAACTWRRRLGQYLLAHNVTTWKAVMEILSRFPYTEQELPAPYPTWFQEVLNEGAPG